MRSATSTGVLLASAASLLRLASAKIVTIKSLADTPFFDPTNTTADVGDVLEFHFMAHNRSVVMGDLENPCQPIASGGFYSGFFIENDTTSENVSASPLLIHPLGNFSNTDATQPTVFRVTVNDTQPIVYYCSQNDPDLGNHCKDSGMAGVVNQPDLTKLQTYRDAAALVNTSITPSSSPFGGVFAANPDTDAVNGNSTSATSAAGVGAQITKTVGVNGAWAMLLVSVFMAL